MTLVWNSAQRDLVTGRSNTGKSHYLVPIHKAAFLRVKCNWDTLETTKTQKSGFQGPWQPEHNTSRLVPQGLRTFQILHIPSLFLDVKPALSKWSPDLLTVSPSQYTEGHMRSCNREHYSTLTCRRQVSWPHGEEGPLLLLHLWPGQGRFLLILIFKSLVVSINLRPINLPNSA